jgi:hypothetical protein
VLPAGRCSPVAASGPPVHAWCAVVLLERVPRWWQPPEWSLRRPTTRRRCRTVKSSSSARLRIPASPPPEHQRRGPRANGEFRLTTSESALGECCSSRKAQLRAQGAGVLLAGESSSAAAPTPHADAGAEMHGGCRISPPRHAAPKARDQMSRSNGFWESAETNQSPGNRPRVDAADLCDSLHGRQQSEPPV